MRTSPTLRAFVGAIGEISIEEAIRAIETHWTEIANEMESASSTPRGSSDRDAARAQQIARWFPPRLCDCTVMEDRCVACAPLAEAVERALTEVRADAYTACSALGWKTPNDRQQRPAVITQLLAVDDTGTVAHYIRELEAKLASLAAERDDEGWHRAYLQIVAELDTLRGHRGTLKARIVNLEAERDEMRQEIGQLNDLKRQKSDARLEQGKEQALRAIAEAHLTGVRGLVTQWRAEAAHKDTVHATTGIGWKVCADKLAAVLSALPSSPSPSWQPMDTAPKDGTEVLVHDEGATMIAWWDADESAWIENGPMRPPPQFWMRLPASPSPVTPRRTCPTCGEPCAQAWCGRCERALPVTPTPETP